MSTKRVMEPPRWKGGPPMCKRENLPALPSQAELDAFLKKNGPSCKVKKTFRCAACGHWHAIIVAPDPSGGSSGSGRSSN